MISRAELDALFGEDDRLRAEHRAYMSQRKALASPPISEAGDPGVLYRDHDANALEAVPAEASEEEPWVFDEAQMDVLAQFVPAEAARAIAPLKRELSYLRGQLDAVLQLLGNRSEEKVIDLPSGILRRRHDAA